MKKVYHMKTRTETFPGCGPGENRTPKKGHSLSHAPVLSGSQIPANAGGRAYFGLTFCLSNTLLDRFHKYGITNIVLESIHNFWSATPIYSNTILESIHTPFHIPEFPYIIGTRSKSKTQLYFFLTAFLDNGMECGYILKLFKN